jgi:hypothetical protein
MSMLMCLVELEYASGSANEDRYDILNFEQALKLKSQILYFFENTTKK